MFKPSDSILVSGLHGKLKIINDITKLKEDFLNSGFIHGFDNDEEAITNIQPIDFTLKSH